MDIRRKRIALAAVLFGVGLTILIGTFLIWPPPADANWLIVGTFAVVSTVLSFSSVEVNDRLQASSSAMVIATSATYFAQVGHTPGTPEFQPTAVALVVLIASLSPFVPDDFRERRFFQPVSNFGQLVISGFCAGIVADLLVHNGPDTENVLYLALVGAVVAVVLILVNLSLVWVGVRIAYGRRNVLPWSGLWSLLGSQIMTGLLGGALGAVFAIADNDSLLVLMFVVYVIGQTVFASWSQLRVAHESTLRGFVKTLETRDLYTRGHTERVAYFAQMIGHEMGFTGTQLEHMRWAALVHDMGKLAIPIELMQKQGKLTDDEYRRLRTATHKVDDLLSEVDFLRPMIDVCSGAHPRLPDEDFGQHGHTHTSSPTLEQKVLAIADAFDAMTSVRGYRMAMSQRAALDSLRSDDTPLYETAVVEALERSLGLAGETYGPPHLAETAEEAGARRG